MHANEGTLDVVVDALIAAGSSFLAYLTIGGMTQDLNAAVVGAGMAMLFAFCGSLAASRRRRGSAEVSMDGGSE